MIGELSPFLSLATSALANQRPPVYRAPDISEDSVRAWLDGGGQRAIEGLGLAAGDRVCVYLDGVSLQVSSIRSPMEELDRIEALVTFVHTLPPAPRQRRPRLPQEFSELPKFTRRWAVGDDLERAEAMERSTERTLRNLVDAVTPRLSEIDRVLDAAGEPLTDDLIDLQAVAQAALEAQIELADRQGRRP